MKLLFLTIITIVFSSNLDAEPQNDSYEAEEALKNLFKDTYSDETTTDPKIPEWRSQLSKAKKRPLNPDEDNVISFIKEETTENNANKEKD